MPACLACFRADVPMSSVLTCQRALCSYVLTYQRVVRAYMFTCQCAVCAYLLMCQRALCALLLTCQRALSAYMLTCESALRAYVLTWQRALCALLLTCQRALSACVPSIITMPCVLIYSHVNVACELKSSCADMPRVPCLIRFAWPRGHLPTCFASSVSSFDDTFFSLTATVVEVVQQLYLRFKSLINIFSQ